MRKLVLIAAMTLAGPLAAPALANTLDLDAELGTTPEAVQASLQEMGFELRKWEMEDGQIEVYAVKDGKAYEVYVDPATGLVSRMKVR